jgi:hypothetical protein
MSTQATQLAPPPEKGTAKGDFFHKDENPFQSLDAAHPPTVEQGEDELETNVTFPLTFWAELNDRTCNSKR